VAPAVAREVLHWSGLAVAVTLIYLLQATGRMTNEAAGLVALVALALTSFLAGIHGNWRFCIVGALLACAVAAAALVEEYLWVLLPLVVLVVAGALFWIRRQGASRAGA
jgi:dipeptide/tripeptide permease